MKLTTDIKPRKDGTITVKTASNVYKFSADESGMLVAEVNEGDVGFLLDTGNFYPADEADIEAGIAAVSGPQDEIADEADIEAGIAAVSGPQDEIADEAGSESPQADEPTAPKLGKKKGK
jgi:hypothetical protein